MHDWDYDAVTRLAFKTPVAALGFDWEVTDRAGTDRFALRWPGFHQYIGGNGAETGFLGIIATGGLIEIADFYIPANGSGGLYEGYLDNIRYSSATVPEPSTFVLLTLGLFGLTWISRRR